MYLKERFNTVIYVKLLICCDWIKYVQIVICNYNFRNLILGTIEEFILIRTIVIYFW